MAEAHDTDTIETAIALYNAGRKIVDIERETGVRRASLYHALKKRRQVPNRTSLAREVRVAHQLGSSTDELALQALMEQLIATQRRLAECEARLAQIRALVNVESTNFSA